MAPGGRRVAGPGGGTGTREMSSGIIVLGRMDTRRLPGRPLRAVAGRPLLGHVLDRLARVPGAPQTVVVTSEREIDDTLADYVVGEGLSVYRGAPDDAASRCLACARLYQWTRFARVVAEWPFVDPELVGRLLEMHQRLDLDVATATIGRAYPQGMAVEVVSVAALAGALPEFTAADRDLVTRFFYRHPERFRIQGIEAPEGDYEGIRLTVEGPEDIVRTGWIMQQIGGAPAVAPFARILELSRQWRAVQAATVEAGRNPSAA